MEREKSTSRWPPSVFFVGIGAALVVATAAAYGGKVFAPPGPTVEPPPLVLSELEETPEVPVAQPAPEPVRVRNPFDKGEIFEFPAGTSADAARDAVAEMLLARARERGAGG
jgi:hypothetical protein